MMNFIVCLGWIGFLAGALRVIPQTILTIKTQDTKNLSIYFFFCHFTAGMFGFSYEVLSHNMSGAHLFFFGMVIITNSIQIAYMLFLDHKLLNPPEHDDSLRGKKIS